MIEKFTKKDLKVGDRLYFHDGFKEGFATLIRNDSVIFDNSGTIVSINNFSDDLEYIYNKRYNILRVERFEEVTKGKGYQLITSDAMILNATSELYKSVVVYKRPEKKIPLLDEKEKEYLSKVIEPFRDEVKHIVKESCIGEEFIAIEFKNDGYLEFPNFKTNSMYKGMKLYKQYKLEELGL